MGSYFVPYMNFARLTFLFAVMLSATPGIFCHALAPNINVEVKSFDNFQGFEKIPKIDKFPPFLKNKQ